MNQHEQQRLADKAHHEGRIEPSDAFVAHNLQRVRVAWAGLWPHVGTDVRSALLAAQSWHAVMEIERDLIDRRWIESFNHRMQAFVNEPMHKWPKP